MSSSGLIFAVIVGAWAAYLVPMWLRRQDELNEARPTERFSTALRLLTRGRRGVPAEPADPSETAEADEAPAPANANAHADVRAYAEPVTTVPPPASPKATPNPRAAARAKVLARRRRTTMVLFLAFTLGGIFALSSGPGMLWLPGIPAVLLLAYVIHVRQQEHRRYAVELDRRRAEEAARRLRQRTQASAAARPDPPAAAKPRAPKPELPARAVVEQTDHAEWVNRQRGSGGATPEDGPDTWDPAPVPLPTYVNAPVAPRTTRGVDLDAPDTWSAARSTTAGGTTPQPRQDPATPRRTPLFDQYADDEHPPRRRRAAGE
ncbi:divisome protein SepX/GlpR [Streptomyces sp. 6N223]|uniref:divisome protein SepX/GlpR n=1 Tax=Streptomyces sp. 6N223 TaxID=3457412 RepID=UPI003FD5A9F8